MTTESMKLGEIYDGLKNKFLFNNDINSIYFLLALYDLEENISNIYPKYITAGNIKRRIRHVLKEKKNKEDIAHNISCLIHEDINRLELCFYLEGYKYGYNNNRWANILEHKAIDHLGIEGMYQTKGLFHFIYDNSEIKELKVKLRNEIDNQEKKSKYLDGLVYAFTDKVIKYKLLNIDKYIDKQLRLDILKDHYNISEEDYKLNDEEIEKIYKVTVNLLTKNIKNIYKDAYWFAINDKVIKRYL